MNTRSGAVMSIYSGSIFLSHSSLDKHFVEKVYRKLDAAGTFYDLKTITPGESF